MSRNCLAFYIATELVKSQLAASAADRYSTSSWAMCYLIETADCRENFVEWFGLKVTGVQTVENDIHDL